MRKTTLWILGVLTMAVLAGTAGIRHSRRLAREHQCVFAARSLGLATHNAAAVWKGWPVYGKTSLGEQPPHWRAMLYCNLDASRCPSPEELKTRPASAFNLGDPHSTRTNVYAVVGEGTIFSEKFASRFDVDVPQRTLMYVSGGESAEPWYDAEDVSIETLRGSTGSIKEVLGEAEAGVTYLVLMNGEVWTVDSSAPASLLAGQANAADPGNEEVAPELAARSTQRH